MIAREIGNGQPLVLIHGFGVDHRIMLPLEGALGDLAWRRIYLDLPWAEHGSRTPAAGAQEVADGVVEEIRNRLGDEPFALIGNSFGGMVARHVAHTLKDQVLGLATLASVFTAIHEDRVLPPRQIIHRDPALIEAGADGSADFEDEAVLQTADAFAGFSEYVLPGLRGADQALMEQIAADYALDTEPELAHAQPFEAPSLHIFGRQDHVTGYEDGWAVRENYPRGTFTVLDAAGHNLHLERPALVSALMRDWIERVEIHVGSGSPASAGLP
ncbi:MULTISPECIES: alpha/beta fold hydrolase [unclassified Arthrobacter]|uniref:alpha/beta fold hydrolase n=1 Tax=unclassified Arthrobacter TaxID=235627 RepID=UPI002105018D|nr:alpha/beta hydrolase [Arthrobacter sp. zg-Y1116]MCQ1987477.1 alpha/beta hydrolase [Arthrobacter sp. zg-Y844]